MKNRKVRIALLIFLLLLTILLLPILLMTNGDSEDASQTGSMTKVGSPPTLYLPTVPRPQIALLEDGIYAVIASRDISRGEMIWNNIDVVQFPIDSLPYSSIVIQNPRSVKAIEEVIDNHVIGKYARADIPAGIPILVSYLTDNPRDFASTGSALGLLGAPISFLAIPVSGDSIMMIPDDLHLYEIVTVSIDFGESETIASAEEVIGFAIVLDINPETRDMTLSIPDPENALVIIWAEENEYPINLARSNSLEPLSLSNYLETQTVDSVISTQVTATAWANHRATVAPTRTAAYWATTAPMLTIQAAYWATATVETHTPTLLSTFTSTPTSTATPLPSTLATQVAPLYTSTALTLTAEHWATSRVITTATARAEYFATYESHIEATETASSLTSTSEN